VAFTVVRGQSNQLIQPVKKAGGKKWKNGKEIPEDFAGGYAYAISTSATVVLSTLQARCVAAGGGGACSFNVTYS
jgi:ribosomal protein S8